MVIVKKIIMKGTPRPIYEIIVDTRDGFYYAEGDSLTLPEWAVEYQLHAERSGELKMDRADMPFSGLDYMVKTVTWRRANGA